MPRATSAPSSNSPPALRPGSRSPPGRRGWRPAPGPRRRAATGQPLGPHGQPARPALDHQVFAIAHRILHVRPSRLSTGPRRALRRGSMDMQRRLGGRRPRRASPSILTGFPGQERSVTSGEIFEAYRRMFATGEDGEVCWWYSGWTFVSIDGYPDIPLSQVVAVMTYRTRTLAGRPVPGRLVRNRCLSGPCDRRTAGKLDQSGHRPGDRAAAQLQRGPGLLCRRPGGGHGASRAGPAPCPAAGVARRLASGTRTLLVPPARAQGPWLPAPGRQPAAARVRRPASSP